MQSLCLLSRCLVCQALGRSQQPLCLHQTFLPHIAQICSLQRLQSLCLLKHYLPRLAQTCSQQLWQPLCLLQPLLAQTHSHRHL